MEYTRESGEIVREFLLAPHNKSRFDRFFALCHGYALGWLRYRKSRGFRLPIDQYAGKDPLADLACDLLGRFFESKRGQSFFHIFDYFARKGITDFRNTDSELLRRHFEILVRGFVKRQLARDRKEQDPQVENLKRRFDESLAGSEYLEPGGGLIVLASSQNDIRPDRPHIERDKLIDLVEQAFNGTKNRSEWCRRIFELMAEQTEYRNALLKHELLTAAVEVNAEHVEIDAPLPSHLPTPSEALLRKDIANAIEAALEWTEANIIAGFVQKKRLSTDESRFFLKAAKLYLEDLGQGGTDLIPTYFKAVMPKQAHGIYLNKYKYLFETVLNKAAENLRARLSDIS